MRVKYAPHISFSFIDDKGLASEACVNPSIRRSSSPPTSPNLPVSGVNVDALVGRLPRCNEWTIYSRQYEETNGEQSGVTAQRHGHRTTPDPLGPRL